MRADPKSIVRTLTPTATRLMEAAAGKTVAAQHYTVEPEHLLLSMLEEQGGDTEAILTHFGVNVGGVRAAIETTVGHLRAGNQGRPSISEHVFSWIEDAWLTSSLMLGQPQVRSGALLLQVIMEPSRYGVELPSALDDVRPEELRSKFADIAGESPEAGEVGRATTQAGGGAPGPSAGGDSALSRFATDFTANARAGKIDPIFGRHREIRQVIDILSRRRKNNPVIVGEPGVGKTALVEGLALAIVAGEVPDALLDVRLLGLDLGALQAGASVKGEFERRLKAVIDEVGASPVPIILFIDEAHTLIGAGGNQGTSDAANLLKPALARGELRTIAATTWAEYKKYFEKDAALERRFQAVKVDEPSEEDAIVMLRGLREVYEQAHGVTIRDEAVDAAVRLSHRYITGRQLPDKAVDLLDTAAARVRVERNAKPEGLVNLEMELAALDRALAALERDALEGGTGFDERIAELQAERARIDGEREALHQRWQTQRKALQELLAAREAVLEASTADEVDADKVAQLQARAREAESELEAEPEAALLSVDLDAEGIARTLASWTGIPVGRMRKDSIGAVLRLHETLQSKVIGQVPAMETLAETLRVAHAKIRDPNTPVGVLLFVGPSGVGKTETAITLAEELYGGEQCMTTINMSEFQEKHSVSRLVGSPPGYVGYGEGGVLTEAVRRRPYSVVLLDECEKADLEVMNLFYQVFDKGVLNDGEGRPIDFRNTIIILTSNLATDLIMDCYADNQAPGTEEVIDLIRPTLSRHFQPALLARMTIVPFRPIDTGAMERITSLKVAKLQRRIEAAHGITTHLEDGLIGRLAARCTAAETGARNVDHVLRGSLMPALANRLLEHMASDEACTRMGIGLDSDGQWQLTLT